MAYTRNTPAWHDYPATDTAIDSTDLEGWENGLLGTNSDLSVLKQVGSDFSPQGSKVDTSKARVFLGSTDPATVTGVIVADGDLWIQYT